MSDCDNRYNLDLFSSCPEISRFVEHFRKVLVKFKTYLLWRYLVVRIFEYSLINSKATLVQLYIYTYIQCGCNCPPHLTFER